MKAITSIFSYVTLFCITGFLFFLQGQMPNLDPIIFKILRGIVLIGLLFVTYKRKKLSLWIFSSMLLAVEVGIDFPSIAVETERFGKIFLRLIKSLVSPLIFATLVVGIAGHSNIKQLGRIGLKSILYFESARDTIALFFI